jgi:NAD(P)-dependent dehydrogenase (short-subunit alcohol dehydrogenase family)
VAIAGHACSCTAVGPANARANHSCVWGLKASSAATIPSGYEPGRAVARSRRHAADDDAVERRERGGSADAVGQPLGDPGAEAALATLADTTPAMYDELFAVNTRAPFFLTQALAPRMGEGGRVIAISSGVTDTAWPHLLAYTMTKAAVEAMTRTPAKDLAARGITVNAVQPGLVDTDMNAPWMRVSEETLAQAAEVSAFGRVGEPRDVADVVAFLAGDDARFVTGQVIDATGGSLL